MSQPGNNGLDPLHSVPAGGQADHGWARALGIESFEPPDTDSAHHRMQATELFACPFLQHDRTRHCNWDGCQHPYYSISSIKQHIEDAHMEKDNRFCFRCGEIFGCLKELAEHGHGGISCFRQDNGICFEKDVVTAEMLVEISRIEESTNNGPSPDAQKWRLVFQVIFPEEVIPSPCKHLLLPQLNTYTSRPKEMDQQKFDGSSKNDRSDPGSLAGTVNPHNEKYDSVNLSKLRVFLKLHREAIQSTVALITRQAQIGENDTRGNNNDSDPSGSVPQSLKRKGVQNTGNANGKYQKSPDDDQGSDTDGEDESRSPKVPRAGAAWGLVGGREHLFRRHKAHEHRCLRCGDSFEDIRSLKAHMRELIACPLRELTNPEGIDGRYTPSFQDTDCEPCNTDYLLSMADIVDSQLQDRVFESCNRDHSSESPMIHDEQAIVRNAYNAIVKPFADIISADYIPDLDFMLAEAWQPLEGATTRQATSGPEPNKTVQPSSSASLRREWDLGSWTWDA
ncbi:hypothetical protein PG994_007151 [Apiospora phragmitis]|uniref:C2H2-type domain-containing protein n=1 Tax=Apiospora phragmitis TaxID=2905665 RepID=A0ABR1UZZ3_9PEZI